MFGWYGGWVVINAPCDETFIPPPPHMVFLYFLFQEEISMSEKSLQISPHVCSYSVPATWGGDIPRGFDGGPPLRILKRRSRDSRGRNGGWGKGGGEGGGPGITSLFESRFFNHYKQL